MTKKILSFLMFLIIAGDAHAQSFVLQKGQVIRKSVKVKKGTYALDAYDSLHKSVIVIEGNNLVIDFNGAELTGSKNKTNPEEFFGVAVFIKGGKNITIKNLKAGGYKIALMARNVEGLIIQNCDFSYNYRKRLNSTRVKEDISDWMSFHQNENDQWLRYGAAMYLRGCNNARISNNTVTNGQNGLMMMECNNAEIFNNNFSFNSGVGLGLYKSSNNRIRFNRINFNVRGYSHGIYSRGQDSAGILVYEQSHWNLFYKNSVTHSGDGFFLWAGQTTMDTGKGGCNDNQLLENDFSFAPTNGVEVTFSRNVISGNRIYECDHGIWGGYSYETTISGNQFRNNRIAIAIEHGQHNKILSNIFFRDGEAIRLWARKQQPSDWGYAKYRDTRSVDYLIALNSFNTIPLVYNLTRTDSIRIFENLYAQPENVFRIDSTVTNLDSSSIDLMDTTGVSYEIPNAIDPFKGNARLAGRKNIMMTEWGPYNFNYPMIWHANPADSSDTLSFQVLGPKGVYKILETKGVAGVSVHTDSFPSSFTAIRDKNERVDLEIIAEFTGPAFTDAFGSKISLNQPHRFSFRKFFQPITFSVGFYAFDSLSNPITTDYKSRIRSQRPFKTENVTSLDYAWWGGIKTGDQQVQKFLTVADGFADFQPGTYEMGITWDDAVRVYVDGKMVLDEWNPSLYKFDESPHRTITLTLGGRHQFRVEHVELGGFATLQLKLNK